MGGGRHHHRSTGHLQVHFQGEAAVKSSAGSGRAPGGQVRAHLSTWAGCRPKRRRPGAGVCAACGPDGQPCPPGDHTGPVLVSAAGVRGAAAPSPRLPAFLIGRHHTPWGTTASWLEQRLLQVWAGSSGQWLPCAPLPSPWVLRRQDSARSLRVAPSLGRSAMGGQGSHNCPRLSLFICKVGITASPTQGAAFGIRGTTRVGEKARQRRCSHSRAGRGRA